MEARWQEHGRHASVIGENMTGPTGRRCGKIEGRGSWWFGTS